jgi:hypothetical protein
VSWQDLSSERAFRSIASIERREFALIKKAEHVLIAKVATTIAEHALARVILRQ